MIETFYLVILTTVLLVLLYSPRLSSKGILAEQYGESATHLFIELNTVVGWVVTLLVGEKVHVDQLHIWRYALY